MTGYLSCVICPSPHILREAKFHPPKGKNKQLEKINYRYSNVEEAEGNDVQ